MKNKQVSINHQLIYRNLGEGSRFCVTDPKTNVINLSFPGCCRPYISIRTIERRRHLGAVFWRLSTVASAVSGSASG